MSSRATQIDALVRTLAAAGPAKGSLSPLHPDCGSGRSRGGLGSAGRLAGLLACGVEPDAPDAAGRTALHGAAAAGRVAAVEVLVAHSADVNRVDSRRVPKSLVSVLTHDSKIPIACAICENMVQLWCQGCEVTPCLSLWA